MSLRIRDRVVVFDYGEVISHSPSTADRAQLIDAAGLPDDPERLSAFAAAYDRNRDDLDEGVLSIRDYWRAIAAELGTTWGDATIDRLWLADFRSWLSINDETLDVLVELHQGGTRMALLSNAGRDFGSYFRHGALGDLFEAAFVSGELGVLKPSAAIFQTVLDDLGIMPSEMIFIDNKEVNVRGAQALGIEGHTFTSAAGLRAYLAGFAS